MSSAGDKSPETMEQEAMTLITEAKAVEDNDPLAAAELYVASVRLLRQARSQARLEAESQRLDKMAKTAMQCFEDCETRVKLQKQQQSVQQQHKTASSGQTLSAGANRHDEAKGSLSWTDWIMGGRGKSADDATSQNPATDFGGHEINMPFRSLPITSPATRSASDAQTPSLTRQASGAATITRQASSGSTIASKTKEKDSLQGIDKQLAHTVLDEIVDTSPGVQFDDIAGLQEAKAALREAVIMPALRPDLFQGLRAPPRGILLFGPPGTGKTLLAKALATESNCRFFNISASSLTSKWVGQAEKMVKALFAVAARLQPSIVFIDEVDSVLGARSENEHEASRRLKTEFLIQFDGVGTSAESRVIVVAATNRPQELDEAVRRRFTKRLYIPLPERATRIQLMSHLLKGQKCSLTPRELESVADMTRGFSGSDLAALCKDAAMGPIRDLGPKIEKASVTDVRAINFRDMQLASSSTRSSVSLEQIRFLEKWNDEFGSYKVPLGEGPRGGKPALPPGRPPVGY